MPCTFAFQISSGAIADVHGAMNRRAIASQGMNPTLSPQPNKGTTEEEGLRDSAVEILEVSEVSEVRGIAPASRVQVSSGSDRLRSCTTPPEHKGVFKLDLLEFGRKSVSQLR